MDSRTKILDSMACHAFWQQKFSEGMGATYLNHKFHGMDLNQWGNISANQVELELNLRMKTAHPGLHGKKLEDAVEHATSSLEQAIFISAEKVIRKKASKLMFHIATGMSHRAAHPEQLKTMLVEVQKIDPGQERVALLEAMGLEPAAARGLDIQMTMNSAQEIFKKLSENRLAMTSRSPLSLDELCENIKETANALRTLAQRLDVHGQIDVFDLCPQIARGVMSHMKTNSIAYKAIDRRLQDHRMYKKADRILGLTAGILFQIGAMTLGPAGEFANFLWNCASAADSIVDGSKHLKLSRLSRVAGTMSQEDFPKQLESAYGQIISGASKAHTLNLPFADAAMGAYASFEK